MSLWYYERDGAQEGPVDADTLRRLVDEGVVARETLVWREGMADWAPAASAAGLYAAPPPLSEAPLLGSSVAPGQAGLGGAAHVDNHLVKAILSTLFCCLPLGIVSIVYASQVQGKADAGDHAGAVEASANADRWANITIAAGLLAGVLYLLGGLGGIL